MLIDTHCHLDFPDFDHDREEVIQKAKEQGIDYIVNIGSSLAASKNSVALAKQHDFIYASVGLHPHEAENFNSRVLEEIKTLVEAPKIVAIGEIGLDYYFREEPKKEIKILQEALFRNLISVAKENNLPLVIHNRDADSDLLKILKAQFRDKKIRGVVHCFSSGEKFLEEILELGLYISFTCNITYPAKLSNIGRDPASGNNIQRGKKADNLRKLVKAAPLERLLLETDAPFLSPQVYRGKRNEPGNVVILAQEIAKIKEIGFEEVAQATSKNARELFSLP